MQRKRETKISTLSFVDVMACGLGSAILLFFILDFRDSVTEQFDNPNKASEISSSDASNERALEAKIALLKKREQEITLQINQISKTLSEKIIAGISAVQNNQVTQNNQATKKINQRDGALIGLSVTGPRVLVILDTSASMSHPRLIDILTGLSDKSGERLRNGKKWNQAKNIGIWLIKNLPSSSKIRILGYAKNITFSDDKWGSASSALQLYKDKTSNLVPKNGTSLIAVLEHVIRNNYRPSDIYLITDGLPTLSSEPSSSSFSKRLKQKISKCGSTNEIVYVDGKCRATLFANAVKNISNTLESKINIILLPLEGDPEAAPLYQRWANSSGGILFSPSSEWLL